jgi:type II secretory pathway component PulF
MNKKTQITISSCLLGGSLIVLAVVTYFAKVFPNTINVWADQGRQLSAIEMFLVNLSHYCKVLGFPLLGLLILSFITSIIWLAVALQARRQER